ncbi:unnamed protein product, partial [Meganyctiphanes norvegica]
MEPLRLNEAGELEEAKKIATKIHNTIHSNGAPIIKKAISTAQNNGHECGIYTMAYAEELAKILYNKELKQIDPLRLKSNATDRIRNELIDQIKKAKRDIDTDSEKKIDKREQTKPITKIDNKDKVWSSPRYEIPDTRRVCSLFLKQQCIEGTKCIERHPDLC